MRYAFVLSLLFAGCESAPQSATPKPDQQAVPLPDAGIQPDLEQDIGQDIEHSVDGADAAQGPPFSKSIEIESVPVASKWTLSTTTAGFSGSGYYQWTGDNRYTSKAIGSELEYTVELPAAGEYVLSLRSRRDKAGDCKNAENDECNDIWVRLNDGEWFKHMAGGPWGKWNDIHSWDRHESGVSQSEFTLPAGPNTIAISGRSQGVKLDTFEVYAAKKYAAGDLLSIHFDHAPDPDDGLAAAAIKTIAEEKGLSPVIVGGTTGTNAAEYIEASEKVMDAVFGAGNWHNARKKWKASVSAVAAQWQATLAAGGIIWVVECGQSDFTADVIKEVLSEAPNIDTKDRVHVVQHSSWNEEYTTTAALAYVKKSSWYVRIDDGNSSNNATADFKETEDAASSAFKKVAEAHPEYGAFWKVAFEYFIPRRNDHTVDFSDTVELLYVLGIAKSEVSDVADFARVFLGAP